MSLNLPDVTSSASQQLQATRRQLLTSAGTGVGMAALASLMNPAGAADRKAPGAHFPGRIKNVIYLFQNGGPTHVDLWDYKQQLQQLHGQTVPAGFVDGKRFSTMTGTPPASSCWPPWNHFDSTARAAPQLARLCHIQLKWPTGCVLLRACTPMLSITLRRSHSCSVAPRFRDARRWGHG